MTILQLVTARQFRGAEVAAASFSRIMLERGHKVLFVGIRKPSTPPLEVPGAACVDLNSGDTDSFLPTFLRLKKLIDREQPDVLHANGSITLKYLVLAKMFYSRARLGYRNISMVSHWIGGGLKHAVVQWIIHQTDFVTSVGEAAREDFIKTYRYPPNKIFVVRRAIPVPKQTVDRAQARERLRIEQHSKVLLNVGNFSIEKGHDILINRFALILKQLPQARLLLVGDGALRVALEDRVKKLHLESAVTFAGLQPDLGNYFAASDLMVMTSRVEGVPGVVMEAAVHRLPTVATDVGGVKESILHLKTGWIFPKDDESIFVNSVVELVQDQATLTQFGRSAYQWVSENFNVDTNADQLMAIFDHS